MYGWSKVRKGEFQGSFYNKHFHRDPNKTNFQWIQRHSSLSSSTRTARQKRKTAVETSHALVAEMQGRGMSPKRASVTVCLEGKVFDAFGELGRILSR